MANSCNSSPRWDFVLGNFLAWTYPGKRRKDSENLGYTPWDSRIRFLSCELSISRDKHTLGWRLDSSTLVFLCIRRLHSLTSVANGLDRLRQDCEPSHSLLVRNMPPWNNTRNYAPLNQLLTHKTRHMDA